MGGNVFPGYTGRMTRKEFLGIENEVMSMLQLSGHALLVYDIPAYKSKESFGDLDLLVVASDSFSRKSLQETFGCGDLISNNGGVWSLVYKDFQVDLITIDCGIARYARNYFSWNDRGNLVGRYAHKLGLKHGHDGLWFPVRSADHVLGEVLLTLNHYQAENFLGVDCRASFDTLEDVFKNVSNSKYFNPDIFLLENRNHTARTRDRKRASYTVFLEWCEVYKKENPEREYFKYEGKSSYIEMIFEEFPHARVEYDKLMEKKRLTELYAMKFNGNLVREWTGKDGVVLGEFMKKLKVFMTKESVAELPEWAVKAVVVAYMERGL